MDGLAPAIAIKQKNQTRNPRSTVATATEIYDYLRLLYARCGTVTCLHCGGTVKRDSVDEIVASLLALPESTRVYALFPIVRAEIKLEPLQPASSVRRHRSPRPSQARKEAPQEKDRQNASDQHRRTSPSPTPSKSVSSNSAAAATTASSSNRHKKQPGNSERSSSSPLPSPSLSSTSPSPSSFSSIASPFRASKSAPASSTPSKPAIAKSGEIQFQYRPQSATKTRTPQSCRYLRRLRVHHLPPRLPRARAAPLLLQQSLRRLPPLPGLRQHHRL